VADLVGHRAAWEPAYFFGGDEPELDGDDDIARYRRAKQAGDAEPVRGLIHPSSTANLIRVCEQLGLDGRPAGTWKPVRCGLWHRLFG
jgi:hypothetical protein